MRYSSTQKHPRRLGRLTYNVRTRVHYGTELFSATHTQIVHKVLLVYTNYGSAIAPQHTHDKMHMHSASYYMQLVGWTIIQ